jgi:predicted MFS family arabinose efflux permease
MGNPQSWYNALYAGFLYLPTAAFGEFWGVDYLVKTNVNMSQQTASLAVSCIFIGWAIGGILIGILSDYMRKRQIIMSFSALISCIMMVPVLYWHEMPVWLVELDLLLFGIMNTGLVLAYATAGELNGEAVSGTSVAFCNMGSILCGTLAMPFIGKALDLFWNGELLEGARVYDLNAYMYAFSWMPLSFLIALVLSRYIEDKV